MPSPPKKKPQRSLADFIRSQPMTMGPTKVVEAARKAGYGKVDPTYVSKVRPMGKGPKKGPLVHQGAIRPNARMQASPAKKAPPPPASERRLPSSEVATFTQDEIVFAQQVQAIGLARAEQILSIVKALGLASVN